MSPLPDGISSSTDLVEVVEQYQKALDSALSKLALTRLERENALLEKEMWREAAKNLGRQVFDMKRKYETSPFTGERIAS